MPSIDLRPSFPSVRDQNPRPTCLSFALSDGHMHYRRNGHHLSTDYLHYHAARRCNGNMNTAVTLGAAVAALATEGQPLEQDCPYDSQRAPGWAPPSSLSPIWQRVAQITNLDVVAHIKATLTQQRCCILALQISTAFFSPDPTTGRIMENSGSDVGGHAVVVVGMDDPPTGPTSFLLRNSWGTGWGLSGHAWVSATYVERTAHAVITM